MKLDRLRTFPELARAIGWTDRYDGRSLMRLCVRREREIKRRFIERDRAGRPWKSTLGAITRYLPELRPARVDSLADSFRGYLAEVDKRAIAAARSEFHQKARPEFDRITSEMARLAKKLEDLGH